MKIVKFFQDVVCKYNEVNKCGYCWTFGFPLSESGLNSSKPKADEQCCLHLFVTQYATDQGYNKNSGTNLPNLEWCDHSFTLFAVQSSAIDLNVYNEQPNHPISESLWNKILEPIQDCLGCGSEFDLCEIGYDFEIVRWKMEVVKHFEDMNYCGWKITGLFRQYK